MPARRRRASRRSYASPARRGPGPCGGVQGGSCGLHRSAHRRHHGGVSLSPGGSSLLVGRAAPGEVRKRPKFQHLEFMALRADGSSGWMLSLLSQRKQCRKWRFPLRGRAASPVSRGNTDRSVIVGKTVTGFTTEGEVMLHVIDKIRQDKVPTIEEGATKVGAKYVSPRPTRSITSPSSMGASSPARTPRAPTTPPRRPSRRSTVSKSIWSHHTQSTSDRLTVGGIHHEQLVQIHPAFQG
jgi:hypothetical protein